MHETGVSRNEVKMIITSSNICMNSVRSYRTEEKRSHQLFMGNAGIGQKNAGSLRSDSMTTFQNIRRAEEVERKDLRKIQEQSLFYLLKYLRQLLSQKTGLQDTQETEPQYVPPSDKVPANYIGSVRDEYYYKEEESTFFETTGMVKTKDGRQIEFNIQLEMTRRFEEYYMSQNDIYAQTTENLVDPLVINLDSDIAKVSDQKFKFDLDADGTEDAISYLQSGSGYLALDHNLDGKINDGSELFGAKSGNGFADLAKYDEDGNGWIDENDSVFEKLLIWAKDEKGNDKLYRLKSKGVGAICLESADTPFHLKSADNRKTNAVIRKTGFFLFENGQSGTMQHVDLAT